MSIILIGAKSKPDEISGQTIAFDYLVKGLSPHSFFVIDINCYSDKLLKKIFYYFKFFLALIKLLLTKKISKVYLTISQSKIGFIRDFGFIWIAVMFRTKIIVHLHGGNYKEFYESQSRTFKNVIKSTLNKASIIIVLSDTLREIFSFLDNYSSKVRVVPNGIETPSLVSQPRKELAGKIKLLFLSNLIESKGYLDVLHAATLLKEKYSTPFELIFCGKFLTSQDDTTFKNVVEARQYFEQYIINNQLSECVKYNGVVTGNKKEDILKWAHFILLPSYYVSEGQPISLIEGLAYGCVPVCTDYRDLKNIARNDWNGIIVSKKNPEDIAEKVTSVIPAFYSKLSENSRALFLEKYTLQNHVRLMEGIFNERI